MIHKSTAPFLLCTTFPNDNDDCKNVTYVLKYYYYRVFDS